MGGRVAEARERDHWRRHQLSIQRSRLIAYGSSAALAAALKLVGGLDFPWWVVPAILLLAVASVGIFRFCIERVDESASDDVWIRQVLFARTVPAWVLLDIVATTLCVWVTGGL